MLEEELEEYKMKRSICFIFFGLMLSFKTIAQPSNIFNGGDCHAYASIELLATSDFQFNSGNDDASDCEIYTEMSLALFNGGIDDGSDSDVFANTSVTFFNSGSNDAAYAQTLLTPLDYLNLGGIDDAYVSITYLEKLLWTGAISSGWNVAGNWNFNVIPTLERDVVIPTGVPNYPALSAGIFAIGSNPNGGSFTCKSLQILPGARLLTRMNNQVENYGYILIEGEMEVRRTETDAFGNFNGGVIEIAPNGILRFN